MTARGLGRLLAASAALIAAAGCGNGKTQAAPDPGAAAVAVSVTAAVQQPVNHVIRATGSLLADEEAEVAAETSGRVTATPVERGSRVAEGAPLVTLVQVEAQAQAAEADANVGQLEARLGLTQGTAFDTENVPEVAAAKASRDLAEADFVRIKSLLEQKVVSQAEYDQRRTQVENARNQYATARNGAQQQYRMLEAARARATLARKALADTVVKAPFAGLVVERKVSVGDFVTRGTKIATVVKISPLRLELTVPEQSAALVTTGQPVRVQVDSFPGRIFTGQVRFVSPSVRADQRALTVEAVVPNADSALKPGMFASTEITLAATDASVVVPAAAVQTIAGVSQVYVVRADRAEQRLVTPGLVLGAQIEILKGLAPGELVVVTRVSELVDGARVRIDAQAPAAGRGASTPVSR